MRGSAIASKLVVLSATVILFVTIGCLSPPGGGSSSGQTNPPAPDSYPKCRYVVPPPTPEPGYLVYDYSSTDQVLCPPPANSGLVETEIIFKRYDDPSGPSEMEVCLHQIPEGWLPPGWHFEKPGITLTQCQWEPILQPAPVGPQTQFIARSP